MLEITGILRVFSSSLFFVHTFEFPLSTVDFRLFSLSNPCDVKDSISQVLGLVVVLMVALFLVSVLLIGFDLTELVSGLAPSFPPKGGGVTALAMVSTTAIPFTSFLASAVADGFTLRLCAALCRQPCAWKEFEGSLGQCGGSTQAETSRQIVSMRTYTN